MTDATPADMAGAAAGDVAGDVVSDLLQRVNGKG
jgi:hypothetical protein